MTYRARIWVLLVVTFVYLFLVVAKKLLHSLAGFGELVAFLILLVLVHAPLAEFVRRLHFALEPFLRRRIR
jgi:uncharacterized membrane protein YhaH (DUF805 family)